jgi:hypothetical protein
VNSFASSLRAPGPALVIMHPVHPCTAQPDGHGGRWAGSRHTRAPRGARPVVKVRGAGGGRVSIAGVACYRPGDRPHLFYKLLAYRRRKGEPKGFSWADYRDLILAAHRELSAPLVWISLTRKRSLVQIQYGPPGVSCFWPNQVVLCGPTTGPTARANACPGLKPPNALDHRRATGTAPADTSARRGVQPRP